MPGWPTYEVSTAGRVKSLRFGRLLSPGVDSRGYLRTILSDHGRKRHVQIHRLVMEAFVGPRPEGLVTRHLNGNPTDNRLENLRYGTPKENAQDAIQHGSNWNLGKTHCPQGHSYSPDNTVFERDGSRKCLICRTERNRRTAALRAAEYIKKGRRKGEACHNATVSDSDIARAREQYFAGLATQVDLATAFGVSKSTIGRWVRGDVRKEASGPTGRVGSGATVTGHRRRAA